MEENLLALSTAHMPSSNPDFGELKVVKFDEGYLVWVLEVPAVILPLSHLTVTRELRLPEWIAPIMELAWQSGCVLIMFDRDCLAYSNPELPVWDW